MHQHSLSLSTNIKKKLNVFIAYAENEERGIVFRSPSGEVDIIATILDQLHTLLEPMLISLEQLLIT